MARQEREAAARLGRRAEALVGAELERRGYQVIGRNVRVGRREIDLIARRPGLLVFVEVRARRAGSLVEPLATITPRKISLVRQAAAQWARGRARGLAMRFDAAAVTFARDGSGDGALDYREDAF